MSNFVFEKLITIGRHLDINIRNLEDEWRLPSSFAGGYADLTEDKEQDLQIFTVAIQDIQDDKNQLIKDCQISNTDETNMDIIFKKAQDLYNILKKDVDILENSFQKYGYHYDGDDVSNATETSECKETDTKSDESDCLNVSEEVVFTPDLGWRRKKSVDKTSSLSENSCLSEECAILKKTTDTSLESKEKERTHYANDINRISDNLNYLTVQQYKQKSNNLLSAINDLHTPKTNMVLSRILSSAKKSKENSLMCSQGLTPLRDRPQCQFYSKNFYNLKKKKIDE